MKMAQLKDDCFAFGGKLILVDDALSMLAERVKPIAATETIDIASGIGRFLAEDIRAPRSVPPYDNSAVDGYAVFFEDLSLRAKTRLPIRGRVAAGHPLKHAPNHGHAIQIFTGAPMPIGMDTVFMEEDCQVEDDTVILPPGLNKGSNRRLKGEDVKQNDLVISTGQRLRPQELGLAASVGYAKLKVFRLLKVAVFSTGDEVCDPSEKASEGSIFDANRFAVMGLLKDLGCKVTDLGIVPDDKNIIANTLKKAATNHDVVITSGGVSAGQEDHIKAAVERNGSIHFWRLSIKPGRPVALGQIANSAFMGLPGNPVAAMVTFMMLARPLLLKLNGAKNLKPRLFPVISGFDYNKKKGRREWVRANLERRGDCLVAHRYVSEGSGILTSMVFADGLVELGEDQSNLHSGDPVNFLPFTEVMR